MAQQKASENKREQLRRYLEKTGVVDSLTSALVCLYEEPERPTDALEYLKKHLNVGDQALGEFVQLQQEAVELRQRCKRRTEEKKELKEKLRRYQPVSQGGAGPE
ncbi:c-Myc-binding protein [Cynoglossus semilaevis]|uniref:c-Myc-binding protein n=1 Tax=Cynoglossus semilaevis TaxID=244447 RepID=UPI000495C229|nr:c-Myc-binding protein [Cynoglossus semilaevis]